MTAVTVQADFVRRAKQGDREAFAVLAGSVVDRSFHEGSLFIVDGGHNLIRLVVVSEP